MSGSPFWNFSLAVYGSPGVPEVCVELQDQAGVDVNVMLYLLWLASNCRELDEAEVRAVVDRVDAWRANVVVPLRIARRALKQVQWSFDTAGVEGLRTKVKAVELESERLQQEALYSWRRAREVGKAAATWEVAARANLAYYSQVLESKFDDRAIRTVIGAVQKVLSR